MSHRVTLIIPAVQNTYLTDLIEALTKAVADSQGASEREKFDLTVEPTWPNVEGP